jgi:multidrug efflux system outer membrane protein
MRFVFLLPVLLVMACSQVPVYQRPESPAPLRWDANASGDASLQASKIHWRHFFTDPRLQVLIATALENNRDVQISAARVREARARFAMAKADRYPLVSLGPGPDTAVLPNVAWPFANISYELDFWGRVEGMTESARMAYLASDEARRTVQLSLVADVAGAYFEILQADELIALTASTVTLRESSLAMLGASRELGASYDYEYLQGQGILESTRASLAVQEHQRALATHRLEFLLGRVNEELPPGRALNEQGLDTDLATGLSSEVLLLRPDVIGAEQRLRAANADIGVARAAHFPKVALTASLGTLGAGLASVLDGKSSILNPAVMLPALFDGGRVAAGLDAAEARKAVAIADYEKTILQAFREVADQISARTSLLRQTKAMEANARAQEERLRIAQARFKLGAIGYLEVIDAQRELLAAQQSGAAVRRAQLDAAVQLYKVLGGGVDALE